jgi:hypothetical protein
VSGLISGPAIAEYNPAVKSLANIFIGWIQKIYGALLQVNRALPQQRGLSPQRFHFATPLSR